MNTVMMMKKTLMVGLNFRRAESGWSLGTRLGFAQVYHIGGIF